MTTKQIREILRGCRKVHDSYGRYYVHKDADELECEALKAKAIGDAAATVAGYGGLTGAHYHENGEFILWDPADGAEFEGPYVCIKTRWSKSRNGRKWRLYIVPVATLYIGMNRVTMRDVNKWEKEYEVWYADSRRFEIMDHD